MYNDIMIDLETFGTGQNAIIASIGACFFDIETGKIGATFELALDFDDQIKRGRMCDMSTIMWWLDQSEGARHALTKAKRAGTEEALNAFTKFYKQHSKVHVWGNGSTFDISLMESTYSSFELKHPWPHWLVMDLRTFRRFDAGGAKVPKGGTNHKALDDAISQAKFVIEHYGKNKK
jgi:hypothetical protein